MMAGHNRARAAYRVPPLAWDDHLAADAAVYARRLAATRRFEHDPQPGRRIKQGENLWMGTRSAYPYGTMIGHWVEEGANYRAGRFPDRSSRTGRWWEVGHYTQIIWPTTTHVGCATASSRKDDYLVCRYLPAGNVVGTVLR